MPELNDTVWTILQILMVVLAVGVTGFLLAMMLLYHASAKREWLALDARMATFGQTNYGRAMYSGYQNLRERVDQPTDALIQKVMAISALKELERRQLLSPQQLSVGATWLLDLAGNLLDGEVDVDLPPMPTMQAKTKQPFPVQGTGAEQHG